MESLKFDTKLFYISFSLDILIHLCESSNCPKQTYQHGKYETDLVNRLSLIIYYSTTVPIVTKTVRRCHDSKFRFTYVRTSFLLLISLSRKCNFLLKHFLFVDSNNRRKDWHYFYTSTISTLTFRFRKHRLVENCYLLIGRPISVQ